jgi:hypothetical protein
MTGSRSGISFNGFERLFYFVCSFYIFWFLNAMEGLCLLKGTGLLIEVWMMSY